MTTTMFLILLSAFSVISGLVTEAVKKLMNDKANLSYNLIALVISLIVGSVGTAIYYQLNGIIFDTNNIIYMILMGFASGLSSMVGYDKVVQSINQLNKKD
jgi:uncharacterized membrane protein YczE